jgi:hypothetical protein
MKKFKRQELKIWYLCRNKKIRYVWHWRRGVSFIMFIVPHVGSDKVPEIARTMGKAMAIRKCD